MEDNDEKKCKETENEKSNFRTQMIDLEASLSEKEERVSQLEQKLSAVQKKCKAYKKECKEMSKELRSRRQDLRDYLRASKRCRMYESSNTCKCQCHHLQSCESETQTFATDFCDAESSGSALDWQPMEGSGFTIADVLKETVSSVNQSDYVYDSNSKLYYSVSTGYYYDPIQKLFYEPHSRIYYSYNESDKTYHFHSQLSDENETTKKAKKKKKGKKKLIKKETETVSIDLEEGELSTESSNSSVVVIEDSTSSDGDNVYPPSMRLIVKKSEQLPTGNLLLVTIDGATVGRTEEQGVVIPDNGISRNHAKIEYSSEKSCYLISDLGSQNGTFINQKRLTEPKVASEEGCPVQHGDFITFGSTELVAHIHSDHNTCGQCEPGLLIQNEIKKEPHYVTNTNDSELTRRKELRKMKKKYALSDYAPDKTVRGYKDRAQERRTTVGSSNPYEKDAEPASVDRPVSADNTGFQMLKKLGWKEGEALGQGNAGRTEPVNAYDDGQIGRAGLGTRAAFKEMCASGDVQIVIVPSDNSKKDIN